MASSAIWAASALASSMALACAPSASTSLSAAVLLSASCWRTASCCLAINVRTGGTTYLTTRNTMTAKPMSCPINVDICV
ncbi:Uncharacterised protein [Mycobacteroides abscessus subsp. abscessus]|nr:Uncharacterised protein [Mycobacteroides abscessus subsp. abscessus]